MRARIDLSAYGLQAPPQRLEIPGGGPQTVGEILDPFASEDPDREALVGRSRRYGYGDLDREVNRAARVLAELGVSPGDRVAVCLPNDVDIVVLFLAAMRLGAIWVGINRALAPPEKRYILDDSESVVLLTEPDVASQLELAGVRIVCVARGGGDSEWHRLLVDSPGATRPAVDIDPFDPAAIAYTSGTTGLPKGAVHSHHNLLLVGAVSSQSAGPPLLRQGVVLPLTILNLIVLGPLAAFRGGACCVAMDRIDPEGIALWVEREQIASFAAVPTIIRDLLTHPNVRPESLASLVRPLVGGAECPEEFRALYRERFGREVSIGYGMTEAPTAVTHADGAQAPTATHADGAAEPRPGLCGRALPQVEISIRGERGDLLPPGELGEICVAPARDGPWAGVYTPMLGYWKRPEATAAALAGGVYHSGDLGLLDDDGVLFIRGRRNELILRGGANVYPAEVERVLQEHASVSEAAVLGRADDRLGERVVAAVQLEAGASVEASELREFTLERLARYKVPDDIHVLKALPRNAMGKVVKRELEPLFDDGATEATGVPSEKLPR